MKLNEEGMAMMVALMTGLIVALICTYALDLAYNQKRQLRTLAASERTKVYYRAQAGMVDATWRIRNNRTLAFTGWTSDFNNANFNPPVYYIDIDTGTYSETNSATADVKVDIGIVNSATGMRSIDSTGLDN